VSVNNLRIAIDASRTTVERVTGTEHYAIELIRAIIRCNQRHHITLYFRDEPHVGLFPKSNLVTYKIIPFRRVWTHLRFAFELLRDRPDVTFVPAHTLPFFISGKCVVTVHDLGYKVFPDAHPPQNRHYLDWTTRFSAWRASYILTDSQATTNDLATYYGTRPEKTQVVYPGVDKPILNTDIDIHEKYQLPERYFVFIGTLQPRKNITRIVQAYQQYRTLTDNPTGLVLAGGKGWLYDDKWTEGIEGVRLTGYIDDADKGALLANAIALVFPSLYEGFGFPVIEAMHSETPVIASNTSSLPELVDDAGLQVNPLDISEITQAMIRIEADQSLRTTLIEQGRKQATQFTWDDAGRITLKMLEKAATS